VAGARLRVADDGHVVLQLRHPWADSTTHRAFTPTALLERLAVLVPRPRVNLVLYHGVLAPRAAWRAEVVPRHAGMMSAADAPLPAAASVAPTPSNLSWAALMQRAFAIDVLACPRCSGRLHMVALIEDAAVARRILTHLGLPTDVPRPSPARAPPWAAHCQGIRGKAVERGGIVSD